MKPADWIKKDKELDEAFKKKKQFPDIGTYKHHPSDYDTFGKQLMLIEEKKVNERKVKFWVLMGVYNEGK